MVFSTGCIVLFFPVIVWKKWRGGDKKLVEATFGV
jgi:hypothetical protein